MGKFKGAFLIAKKISISGAGLYEADGEIRILMPLSQGDVRITNYHEV